MRVDEAWVTPRRVQLAVGSGRACPTSPYSCAIGQLETVELATEGPGKQAFAPIPKWWWMRGDSTWVVAGAQRRQELRAVPTRTLLGALVEQVLGIERAQPV